MSRTDLEREFRRRHILESARKLFQDKDLESCSMDDVAAAAEYSRRTLYSYFGSRDELYLLLHLEDLERRRRIQQARVAAASGGWMRLAAWARALFEDGLEQPQARRMDAYWDYRGIDPASIDPEVFGRFEILNGELAEDLRALFRAGITDGSLRGDLDVDMTISQFLYSLRAIIGRAVSSGYTFAAVEPHAYFDSFLDLFGRGLRPERGASC